MNWSSLTERLMIMWMKISVKRTREFTHQVFRVLPPKHLNEVIKGSLLFMSAILLFEILYADFYSIWFRKQMHFFKTRGGSNVSNVNVKNKIISILAIQINSRHVI